MSSGEPTRLEGDENPMNLSEAGLRLEQMEFYELLSYARSLEIREARVRALVEKWRETQLVGGHTIYHQGVMAPRFADELEAALAAAPTGSTEEDG